MLRKFTEQADKSLLRFQLTSVQYMELTENPRENYRVEAADAMKALSSFRAMAPGRKVVEEELAKELNRRFGQPAFPVKVPKFGTGVGFALGFETRIIDGLSEEDRLLVEAGIGRTVEEALAEASDEMEYLSIATPSAIRSKVKGFDPYAARSQADRDLDSLKVMVDTIRTDQSLASRPIDVVCARQLLFDIEDQYTRALWNGGFKSGFPNATGEVLTDFLMHLPTRRVWTMMMFHYLKDINRDLTINDLRDLEGVSIGIPYCDIVVADKKVRDAAVNRAHLDREFDTAIFSKLTDVVDHLGL